jgi:hypothetical protein
MRFLFELGIKEIVAKPEFREDIAALIYRRTVGMLAECTQDVYLLDRL